MWESISRGGADANTKKTPATQDGGKGRKRHRRWTLERLDIGHGVTPWVASGDWPFPANRHMYALEPITAGPIHLYRFSGISR